jgi:hypothetical protein
MVAMTQALWVIYEKPPVENPSIGVVEIKQRFGFLGIMK